MSYATDKKPGELTALTTLATDDVFVVGDTSDASEVAKGITKADLLTDFGATFEPLKGADDNYVTDAEKVVIGNTSGTNTGDSASLPIGGGTLTGSLTLVTGTTSVAPIKLVAGTNLTTPTAGVVEFDGVDFYITI